LQGPGTAIAVLAS